MTRSRQRLSERFEVFGDDAVDAPAAEPPCLLDADDGPRDTSSARWRRSATVARSSSRRWTDTPARRRPAKRRRSARNWRRLPTECTTLTPGPPWNGSSSRQLREHTATSPAGRWRAIERPRGGPARRREPLRSSISTSRSQLPRAAPRAPAAGVPGARDTSDPTGQGSGPSVFRCRTSSRPPNRCTSASITAAEPAEPGAAPLGRCPLGGRRRTARRACMSSVVASTPTL